MKTCIHRPFSQHLSAPADCEACDVKRNSLKCFTLIECPPSKAGGVLSEEESDSAKFPREADSLTPRRDGRPSRRERGDNGAPRGLRPPLAGVERGTRSPSGR